MGCGGRLVGWMLMLGVPVYAPARHTEVHSGFFYMADLRGQTHNQPIIWSVLGYLEVSTRWHGLWWPTGWLDITAGHPKCKRRVGTLECIADSSMWPT